MDVWSKKFKTETPISKNSKLKWKLIVNNFIIICELVILCDDCHNKNFPSFRWKGVDMCLYYRFIGPLLRTKNSLLIILASMKNPWHKLYVLLNNIIQINTPSTHHAKILYAWMEINLCISGVIICILKNLLCTLNFLCFKNKNIFIKNANFLKCQ